MHRFLFACVAVMTVLMTVTGDAATHAPSHIVRRIQSEFPGVAHLSTAQLAGMLSSTNTPRPILLDVRRADEFRVSHLPGARHAPDVTHALRVLRESGRARPVVAYCSVGYRSARLVASLQELGVTNAFNLQGSIFAWANEGRPLVGPAGAARTVHPYDADWGRLLRRELWSEKW